MNNSHYTYVPGSNALFTQLHVLAYLDKKGEDGARMYEIAKVHGQHTFKIYKILQRLIADSLVRKKKLPCKNHETMFYFLTDYAHNWKLKHNLYSFLQKEGNPKFKSAQKIVEKYKSAQRKRIGNKVVFIPRKELRGFL